MQKINKIIVPTGDKGVPGERDDMFNPQITDKYGRYEHLQRYKYALKRCKGRILDLGCGTGYGTKMLYDKGNEVFGIDISQAAINYAKNKYPGPDIFVVPQRNYHLKIITSTELQLLKL